MNKQSSLNVLISAYFCDPYKGSEESVGWNFSKSMARYHNIWVLTKESNRKPIELEMARNPVEGLSFIYYDIPKNRFFNEKVLGEQIAYIIWQLMVKNTYNRVSKQV